MKTDNQIVNDSKAFAIRSIRLYKYLVEEKKEYVMSKQILRSGTSIGANVSEGIFAQSSQDFICKMSIALKEANETRYWLELLSETGYIAQDHFASISDDINKIIGTLVNIIKTTRLHKG